MWQNQVIIDLVEWLKEYNRKVNFALDKMAYIFGIDCQQIYRSLNSLYDSLTDLDIKYCFEIKSTLSFFNGFGDSEWEYANKTVGQIGSENIPEILQKMLSEFQWHKFDDFKKRLPKERFMELINIEANLEVLISAEEYYRKSKLEPRGSQVSWNTRDQHMTLAVERIRQRIKDLSSSMQPGDSTIETPKVIAWAHNSHIGNAAATSRGGIDFTRNDTWNLGQMVKQTYAHNCLLGFSTYNGQVTALDPNKDGTKEFHLMDAIPGSFEYFFHKVCEKRICDSMFIPLNQYKSQEVREDTKLYIENLPIPHQYRVVYSTLDLYKSDKMRADVLKEKAFKFGDVIYATERSWLPNGSTRLKTANGWVIEYSPYSGLCFLVRVLEYHYPENPTEFLSSQLPQRYIGIHYCPSTEMSSHYTEGNMSDQYDGLIFVDTTSALPFVECKVTKPKGKSDKVVSRDGVRRLVNEYKQISKHPIPNVLVHPKEEDIYTCYFVILGTSGDYKGGKYLGCLELPPQYPMAPPRIMFLTPNGRFETNTKICVSFSDYHPELWNPSWGIESVLIGLYSFMLEDGHLGAIGSIQESPAKRRQYAKESHNFNMQFPFYAQYFCTESGQEIEPTTGDEMEEENEKFCRYCRESSGKLISPCECKGGNQWVHMECLAKWQYQSILQQSTHPKYQTGTEKRCNVCFKEFKVQQFDREQLMLTFTGTEIANLVQLGSLLVATDKSSRRNIELIKEYPDLEDSLVHWTHSVYLIIQVTRAHAKEKGKVQDSIVGVNLVRKATQMHTYQQQLTQKILHYGVRSDHFIGGPVEPQYPFILASFRHSQIEHVIEHYEGVRRVCLFAAQNLSVWHIENPLLLFERHGILEKCRAYLVDLRVYWGVAGWNRVQLLGEIARGGWGLCLPTVDNWIDVEQCWNASVKKAIVCGKNDLSSDYEKI